MFEKLEAKRSVVIPHVKVKHPPLYVSITRMHALMIEHSIFSIMAELIVEMLFCSVFIMLRNGSRMSEYEAYYLTDFPLINSWACNNK